METVLKRALVRHFEGIPGRTEAEERLLRAVRSDMLEFPVLVVSRDDLTEFGFDPGQDDETMERLASRMGDAYLSFGWSQDLVEACEELGIKKTRQE